MRSAPLPIFLAPSLLLLLNTCDLSAQQRVRGVFTYGFEVMSFQPCGSAECWWVSEGSQSILHHSGAPQSPPPGQHLLTMYVELRGHVSPKGGYGHQGAYSRSLTVKEVLLVTAETPASCR